MNQANTNKPREKALKLEYEQRARWQKESIGSKTHYVKDFVEQGSYGQFFVHGGLRKLVPAFEWIQKKPSRNGAATLNSDM